MKLLKKLGVMAGLTVCLLFPVFSEAQESSKIVNYTLTWDANSESDLAGYRVYIGQSSRSYDAVIDLANVGNPLATSYEGSHDIAPNTEETWYYAVTAYDTSNLESDYSNEVSHTYKGDDTLPPSPPSNLNWFERLIAWVVKHFKFWS